MILSKTPHKLGCVIKTSPTLVKIDVSRSEFVEQILISAESNHKSGIELSCFELSQDSIFFPDFCVVEEYEPENELLEKLVFFLRNSSHRIFFILPHYYFLGSQIQTVVSDTSSLLYKISYFLEHLGIKTPSIIIRIGSAYGNRKITMTRFNSEVHKLHSGVRKLLCVTNDEKPSLFSVTDLMSGVFYATKLPICFRFLPHQFNSGGLSAREALFLSCSTWQDGIKPIFIHGEPEEIDDNGLALSVVPSVLLKHRIPTFGLDVDVVIDTPDSKKACVRYMAESYGLKPIVINKIGK